MRRVICIGQGAHAPHARKGLVLRPDTFESRAPNTADGNELSLIIIAGTKPNVHTKIQICTYCICGTKGSHMLTRMHTSRRRSGLLLVSDN